MPNLQPKILYIGNGTGDNVYTVSNTTGNYTIIKNIHICNANTTSAKNVTIHILSPTNNTAQSNNIFISNVAIPTNDILQIDSAISMQEGYSIYISHTGNITTTISGVEFS